MEKRSINFGVIGCGLMGREFASATARWCHLEGLSFRPNIAAACDLNANALRWFEENVPGVQVTTDYRALLDDPGVDAIYCAVPHHLHESLYVDIVSSGKHLLGEKPFGIDQAANETINEAIRKHPEILVRCSSEFPFFPGAYRLGTWIRENRFGRIIEVEAGFWHSSDLDPEKPINWKRVVANNGEYGCMGDLGMHVLHLPLRCGWMPRNVHALLSNVVTERPNDDGKRVPCDTWDNAVLACQVETPTQAFPMVLSTKRIAPGHANTWFIKVYGTELSAEFSTKHPKRLRWLPYVPGNDQVWHVADTPYESSYKTITGKIFEFGFSDAILQMWAAFCDELAHGRDNMHQPLYCATPEEAAQSHALFTAALASQKNSQAVSIHA